MKPHTLKPEVQTALDRPKAPAPRNVRSLPNHACAELKVRLQLPGLKVVHANFADMALPGPGRSAPRTVVMRNLGLVLVRNLSQGSFVSCFRVAFWGSGFRAGHSTQKNRKMPIGPTASCLPVIKFPSVKPGLFLTPRAVRRELSL